MAIPKTLQQAIQYYSDEQVCIDAVAMMRWPKGVPVCPACGHKDHYYLKTQKRWKCKNGISSYEISRDLGVSQKAGWFMLQRLRLALQDGFFGSKLSGEVEVDETFIGGKARNMHVNERKRRITGTGTKDKTA